MARVYVTYHVPAGSEGNLPAESPATIALVPLPGPADATPPTAFGGNSYQDTSSGSYAALIGALSITPGANWHEKSWKTWTYQADWIDWLAADGLQPQQSG
jgi:hypothetical protein